MLATADITFPSMKLIGVIALTRAGWMMKMDSMGNSRDPWMILTMANGSPQIRGWVRENRRSCWKAALYATGRRPFTKYTASLRTLTNFSASRDGMGWNGLHEYHIQDVAR